MTSLKSPPLSSNGPMAAAVTSFPQLNGGLSAARFFGVVGLCAVFCLMVLIVTPWVGTTGVTWRNVLAGASPDREIFFVARLPRVLFGALVGGALATAGVLFQAILRNYLPEQLQLCVSGGRHLG